MNLTFRRHYGLIMVLILLGAVLISAGSMRIISYNFGDHYNAEITNAVDFTNEIDLFDDSMVHEINFTMADGDYEKMLATYESSNEKDWYKTDIIIDGVEVENVGIRLKGNLTLRQSTGTNMGGGVGRERPNGNMQLPEGFAPPEGMVIPENVQTDTSITELTAEEIAAAQQEMRNPFSGRAEQVERTPPFLVKFDKFVEGQTYQGYGEIAIRIGGDNALLNEQIAFYVHETLGQIVPQTAYAYVTSKDQEPSLYVIAENIDEKYIAMHFPETSGILYKAGNFTGFEYVGEDPTLYNEKFEQKSGINDDDLSQLIRLLKFVTESTDEEFEAQLANWIDLESLTRMMALDNLLSNNDSFVGMGSNYFLYYNKDTEQFTILSWDMNLAMGGMGGGGMGGGMRQGNMPEGFVFPKGVELPEGFVPPAEMQANMIAQTDTDTAIQTTRQRPVMPEGMQGPGGQGGNGGGMNRNNTNVLKERFFANETFSKMYEEEYARLKNIVYGEDLALKKVEQLAEVFTTFNADHNVVEQSTYDAAVATLKQYIERQKTSETSTVTLL
ncbi:CotH kinase family protein [Candidatus Peregrinibacteria bacterium]|nr:CotH kinase family protein [Candidatus Peregrinibacteria bacterium]